CKVRLRLSRLQRRAGIHGRTERPAENERRNRAKRQSGVEKLEVPRAALAGQPRAAVRMQASMTHKVTLIPGDGIGPEVVQATVRMLEATGVRFEWESFAAGAEAFEKYHEYIPKELSESIERTRVGLKGPVTTPIGGGFASINVELRKRFELFANFRPIRNLPHIPTRYPGGLDRRARKHGRTLLR